MQLTVKGKHLDVGDALRAHVQEQLNHTAKKYFRDPIEATVIFSKEKNHLFKADISIHVGGGIVLQTHHEAADPYPAFDAAAKAAGKRFADHAAHLVVHGVLHLAGYDHERPRDAKVMEPLEVKILAKLGIENPYEMADA